MLEPGNQEPGFRLKKDGYSSTPITCNSTPNRKVGPSLCHKLQELVDGAFGEMTVTMQYLIQGGIVAWRVSTRT